MLKQGFKKEEERKGASGSLVLWEFPNLLSTSEVQQKHLNLIF